jgi:CheY-like chemotaxis protein
MRTNHASTAKTILVVEDERIVAKDLQHLLSGFGYGVPATAASSEEAIRLAAETCPDLVLMDIRIKGQRDGIETAAILRERFGVPIVYLTAHADQDAVARAKKTEPYGYLVKPVRADELRSTIEIALYKHETERRLRER